MPKRSKPTNAKAGQATALDALKRLASSRNGEPDVATLKRGKVEEPDAAALKRIFDDAAKTDVTGGTIKWLDVDCPHCGESFEIRVDSSQEAQELVQDCQACSQSVTLAVDVEDGEVSVNAYS